MHVCLLLPARSAIRADRAVPEIGPNRPDGIFVCPVCDVALSLRAKTSVKRTIHFKHPPGADCPTVDAAAQPFRHLRPSEPDPHARQARQAEFLANWERHFRRLSDLVPALSMDEFIARMDLSVRLDIWSYVGLAQSEIPIILALLDEFSPYTARKVKYVSPRRYWYRFWVRHRGTAGGEWPWPQGDVVISRGRFRDRGPDDPPRGRDFIDLDLIEVDDGFLGMPKQKLHQMRLNAFERWLARHPAFGR